jgi:hypothetical protein
MFYLLKDHNKKVKRSLVGWYTLVIPALRRKRQEDGEFQASLGYMVRPYSCLLKKKITYPDTWFCSSHT